MNSAIVPSLLIALLVGGIAWYSTRVFAEAATGYREQFKQNASRNLAAMFLFIDGDRLFFLNIAAVIAIFLVVLLITGNVIIAALPAVAVGASTPIVLRILTQRRRNQIVQSMPDTLMSMAANMKSGLAMTQAIETVVSFEKGPLAQELDLLLRELRLGVAFDLALDHFYERIPRVEIQLLTAAMKISRETGGNLAETLERISATLRSKLQMEGKINSLTAQGKLQGWVMTALPIMLGVVLFRMEPKAMSYLFTEWYGWAVIGVIATLEMVGFFIISKIVSIDV
jgi:tight adherence protein B